MVAYCDAAEVVGLGRAHDLALGRAVDADEAEVPLDVAPVQREIRAPLANSSVASGR